MKHIQLILAAMLLTSCASFPGYHGPSVSYVMDPNELSVKVTVFTKDAPAPAVQPIPSGK